MRFISSLTFAVALLALCGCRQDPGPGPPADKKAMALYRQAQALMEAGQHEAGYEAAHKAMAQFIAEDDDLRWMLLETVLLEDRRIDVHFNMGPSERTLPDKGIVRPLSFHVWSTGDDARILKMYDFEIGRAGGRSITAAIGRTHDRTVDPHLPDHTNFGGLPVDSSYEAIKQAVLDLVTRAESGSE